MKILSINEKFVLSEDKANKLYEEFDIPRLFLNSEDVITAGQLYEFIPWEVIINNDLCEIAVGNDIIDNVDIPVIMGGGIKTQRQANNVLNKTKVDFISMQRPFVADPSFLIDWQFEGDGEVKCKTCNNCYWKKTSTCFIYPKATLNVNYPEDSF